MKVTFHDQNMEVFLNNLTTSKSSCLKQVTYRVIQFYRQCGGWFNLLILDQTHDYSWSSDSSNVNRATEYDIKCHSGCSQRSLNDTSFFIRFYTVWFCQLVVNLPRCFFMMKECFHPQKNWRIISTFGRYTYWFSASSYVPHCWILLQKNL